MRPTIICHMITSLDGRLYPAHWSEAADQSISSLIDQHYEATADRLAAEGWIAGRKTMAEYLQQGEPATLLTKPLTRPIFAGDVAGRHLAVAIDPAGRLRFDDDHIGGDHALVVLSERVPAQTLERLQASGVSYVFAGPDGDRLDCALTAIAKTFGTQRLLLEGGGLTNGAFWAAGLIDEISLLICPTLDGQSGVAAIFDYTGPVALPVPGQTLRLSTCATLEGGVVWLRHEVVRQAV